MKEELVKFDTAKLAKEKGFDALCTNTYNSKGILSEEWNVNPEDLNENNFYCTKDNIHVDYTLAPTQSLLQKWLREEHKLYVTVDVCVYGDEGRYAAELSGHGKGGFMPVLLDGFTIYSTYEEALEEGLREALILLN